MKLNSIVQKNTNNLSNSIRFYSINILLLFCFQLVNCSKQNFPKYSSLDQLRVLALIAQPPEVNPGDTVLITPLVSDVNEASGLNFFAYACLDQGIAFGAEPTCQGNSSKITLSSGNISTLNLLKAFTGIADSISVTIPDHSTLLNLRSVQQQYNGVSYIFEYVLRNSRGDEVKSIKRINVSSSSKVLKNTNPIISDILFNGNIAPSTLPPSTTIVSSIDFVSGSNETYSKMMGDGQIQSEDEELTTTWFITDGNIKYQRTVGSDSNTFESPTQLPTSRPSYLIGVSRDGRGGVGYKIKCFGTCI